MKIQKGDAILVIDVQNDFLPGGALPVPGGGEVIEPLNRVLNAFRAQGLPIVMSRHWHPADHASFQSRGGPRPPHCVAGTPGAAFASELELPCDVPVISKGEMRDKSDCSDFGEGSALAGMLREAGVWRLFVGGLATDNDVRATVLDALRESFEVWVLSDAIRAIDDADGVRALAEMEKAGAHFIASTDVEE